MSPLSLSLCLLLATSATAPARAPASAPAAAADEARARKLINARKFAEAAAIYEELWRTDPRPRYLFNAAMARELSGGKTLAYLHFTRYLAQPDLPADGSAQARTHLQALRRRTNSLRVYLSPAPDVVLTLHREAPEKAAPLRIDLDAELLALLAMPDQADTYQLYVEAGVWTVEASAPGYAPQQRTLTVLPRESSGLTIELHSLAPPEPEPPASEPVVSPRVEPPPPELPNPPPVSHVGPIDAPPAVETQSRRRYAIALISGGAAVFAGGAALIAGGGVQQPRYHEHFRYACPDMPEQLCQSADGDAFQWRASMYYRAGASVAGVGATSLLYGVALSRRPAWRQWRAQVAVGGVLVAVGTASAVLAYTGTSGTREILYSSFPDLTIHGFRARLVAESLGFALGSSGIALIVLGPLSHSLARRHGWSERTTLTPRLTPTTAQLELRLSF